MNRIAAWMMAATLILTGLLVTASPAKADPHISIGIGVGPGYYAPPPVIYRPPYPGPGYYWTDGYYDPYGVWVGGFWGRGFGRRYGYGYMLDLASVADTLADTDLVSIAMTSAGGATGIVDAEMETGAAVN
jgi:hypothetical protein